MRRDSRGRFFLVQVLIYQELDRLLIKWTSPITETEPRWFVPFLTIKITINLEIVILSEVSQTERDKHMISLICGI